MYLVIPYDFTQARVSLAYVTEKFGDAHFRNLEIGLILLENRVLVYLYRKSSNQGRNG